MEEHDWVEAKIVEKEPQPPEEEVSLLKIAVFLTLLFLLVVVLFPIFVVLLSIFVRLFWPGLILIGLVWLLLRGAKRSK